MTPRSFLLLLGLTAASVALAVFSLLSRPGDYTVAKAGEPLIPGLEENLNDVVKVVLKTKELGALTFEKDGAGWTMAERGGYGANPALINRMLIQMSGLTYLAPKTRLPERYEFLGLRDPGHPASKSSRVELFNTAGEKVADVITGAARTGLEGETEGAVYVRFEGDPQTWLAKGELDMGPEARDWIDRNPVKLEPKGVRQVRVTFPDGETFSVFKDQVDDGDYILDGAPDDRAPKNAFTVNAVASSIGDHVLEDAFPKGAVALGETPDVTFVYETFDGLELTSRFWKAAAEEADERAKYYMEISVGGAAAAHLGEDLKKAVTGWTFEISEFRYNKFIKRVTDLTDPLQPPES